MSGTPPLVGEHDLQTRALSSKSLGIYLQRKSKLLEEIFHMDFRLSLDLDFGGECHYRSKSALWVIKIFLNDFTKHLDDFTDHGTQL